jgi:ankyrin repeat protein
LEEHTTSAAEKGHAEIARLLLDSGADATLANDNMFTPLHKAASGHLDLVKLLLKDVPIQKLLPMVHHLILLLDAARLLLDSGADATLADDNMITPLHYAHNQGISILLNCFWKRRADPNAVTKWKDTPLHYAAEKGHAEIARLLLDSGADATLANDNMITPLHWAAQSGHLDLVKLLLERRADPNAVTKRKDTPLNLAASKWTC